MFNGHCHSLVIVAKQIHVQAHWIDCTHYVVTGTYIGVEGVGHGVGYGDVHSMEKVIQSVVIYRFGAADISMFLQ